MRTRCARTLAPSSPALWDLRRSLAWLRQSEGKARVGVMGYSLGAGTALRLAIRRPELIDDAVLVASELASNALLHANGIVRVSVTEHGDAVRIAVHDRTRVPPVMARPSLEAMTGRGLALVAASLLQGLIAATVSLALGRHSLRPLLAPAETRELLNFGFGVLLNRTVVYASYNGDNFVVGRWLGPAALGLYTRAFQLMMLPLAHLQSVTWNVMFAAYSRLQQSEFGSEQHGYTATRHQREVGTGYFDKVAEVISGGCSSTLALNDSTEAHQF